MKAHQNPFATERVERSLCYDPAWHATTWEDIEDRWESGGRRGAIVGPHGSGKTTFFDASERRLADLGEPVIRLTLDERVPRIDQLQEVRGRVILLDSAGWLGFFAWRRFLKMTESARGLIVSQHRAHRLPTILKTTASSEMLAAFIEQLCPGFEIDAKALFRRHRGNIREALLECYDRAAKDSIACTLD